MWSVTQAPVSVCMYSTYTCIVYGLVCRAHCSASYMHVNTLGSYSDTYAFYGADILTEDDLPTLLNELNDIIDIWFRFGVQLRVPISRLNAIKREHSNPDDCLMHMLIFWLSNTIPSPTWETVVDALCCAAIGREQMADKIRIKYCNQSTSNLSYA